MRGTTRAAAAAGIVLGALLPSWYEAAVAAMVRHNTRRMREGDLGPQLRGYAEDVRFTFPGDSSWAGEYHGRGEVEQWLRRFLDAGIVIDFDDVLVSGPPWATRLCLRFHNYAAEGAGEVVYTNQGTIYGQVRWGRITRYEVAEDTVRSKEFDEHLARSR